MNSTSSRRQWFAERPYLIAIAITITIVLWMFSGTMKAEETSNEIEKNAPPIPKVKVETLYAVGVSDNVELYGRTEPDRTTTLKAELGGQITQVFATRGAFVKKGDVIAKLEVNDLKMQLDRSKALLSQRELEYEGAKSLNEDGYQGRVQVTSAYANLQAVRADITRLEISLENTTIKAPYDGVLNERYVEQGDYVQSGDEVALIADLSPLIVRAHVTENQIQHLMVAQDAQIKLLNRQNVAGKIRYIASVADSNTNTFKIEIAIENADNKIKAGISSEVNIPLTEVAAIKISPALLALDAMGNIGVKTVENDQVIFTEIDIVKTESDGIWLKGLGEQADVITLGQGFVREGDTVEAVMTKPSASVTGK